jgi:hypothetical protein
LNKAENNLPGIIFRPAVEEDEQVMLRGHADHARFLMTRSLKPGKY